MKRSTDRILTTFVGSLVRPAELRDLLTSRSQHAEVDERVFAETLRKSVADSVRQEVAVGLDIVSDGEFGKSNWAGYIVERVTG